MQLPIKQKETPVLKSRKRNKSAEQLSKFFLKAHVTQYADLSNLPFRETISYLGILVYQYYHPSAW